MSEERTVYVCKAAPIGPKPVTGAVIKIILDLAPDEPTYEDIKSGDWHARLDADAERVEEALHASLPGGTYDRVMLRMMERKVSMLRVPLGG